MMTRGLTVTSALALLLAIFQSTTAHAAGMKDPGRQQRIWCTIDGTPQILAANKTPDMQTGDQPTKTVIMNGSGKVKRAHFAIRLANGKRQFIGARLIGLHIELTTHFDGRTISAVEQQDLVLGDAKVNCVHIDDETID